MTPTKQLTWKGTILAIDTSCDETAVAVVQDRKVLSSVISSQVELHKKWGGVVPAIARRAHEENIESAFHEAVKRSGVMMNDVNGIAVTIGPGLAIDLEVGIDFAKKISREYKKPLIPVNHMEGHLLSSLLLNASGNGSFEQDPDELLPFLGMLISGKHTEIIRVEKFGEYKKLGWTLDDAAGEAFDKVGRVLGFGYPGGPIISEFAKKAPRKENFGLPIPMERSGDMNFSYSGLKTASLYRVTELREKGRKDTEWVADFCWEFVDSITKSIINKVGMALDEFPDTKGILTGGGVYNNEYLVRTLGSYVRSRGVQIYFPDKKYRGDNAAMIGIAGLRMFNHNNYLISEKQVEQVDRVPRFSIEDIIAPNI